MILFNLFAGTDIGLRDNNEDNFTVCPDLSDGKWMVPDNHDGTIPLGKLGCLMAVADGMGGMNAGEVASDIAIKTVQQMFAPTVLSLDIVEKPENVKAYLKDVIIKADLQIKQHCEDDPATEGMGSTIIIAWLIRNTVYVAWLGDSRAYSFIPEKGISRLSKDHSYVQQLVDAKMLTEEDALIHPQSNVVTRSLGDNSQNAKPDVISHVVQKGEIILLCSDGLCGVCTDAEISNIVINESTDLPKCKEVLTEAALKGGGSDNITVALLQIVNNDTDAVFNPKEKKIFGWNNNMLWKLLCCLAVCLIGSLWILFGSSNSDKKKNVEKIELKLQSNTMYYGDSLPYSVIISPSDACQEYLFDYCDKDVFVDSISKTITMKRNKSGKTMIVAISQDDSLKRDTIELILQKKIETVVVAEESSVKETISVSLNIIHSGPLEAGNNYSYSVIIKPNIVSKGGYLIACNEPSVIIDDINHMISVPDNLKISGKCVFTISPKLKPLIKQTFEYDLKASEITFSEEKMTTTNKLKINEQ